MIVLAVAVLAAWAVAATVLVGRRYPVPTVAAQAPIGPMTPTFRDRSTAVVAALPGRRELASTTAA